MLPDLRDKTQLYHLLHQSNYDVYGQFKLNQDSAQCKIGAGFIKLKQRLRTPLNFINPSTRSDNLIRQDI